MLSIQDKEVSNVVMPRFPQMSRERQPAKKRFIQCPMISATRTLCGAGGGVRKDCPKEGPFRWEPKITRITQATGQHAPRLLRAPVSHLWTKWHTQARNRAHV